MPNLIRVSVENPDALLNAGMYGAGAIVRLQSGAAEAGPFANESTAAIVAATRSYTLYDADGTTSTWYRTRYENAGGTTTSEWSAAFQAGGEEAGGLCSLDDVRQDLGAASTSTQHDELILDLIDEITNDVVGYTGRRFVRYPLAGTTTFLLDVERDSRELWVPQGIAALSALEVATESQPDTGGAYTAATMTDVLLRPATVSRDRGWPATRIVIRDNATGPITQFNAGYNAVRVTGALGWDRVPPEISGMARRAVVRRFKNRNAAHASQQGAPSDLFARWTFTIEEQRRIDWYRVPVAG